MERLIDVLQTGIEDIYKLNESLDLAALQEHITAIAGKIKTLSHPRYAEETQRLQQLLNQQPEGSGNGKTERPAEIFLRTRSIALGVLESVLEMED